MKYEKEQLIRLHGLLLKLARGGTYNIDQPEFRGIIEVLVGTAGKIKYNGYDCDLFLASFKDTADHKRSVHTLGHPCFWWDLYDILVTKELRDMPLKIHHTLKPIVEWRLKEGV